MNWTPSDTIVEVFLIFAPYIIITIFVLVALIALWFIFKEDTPININNDIKYKGNYAIYEEACYLEDEERLKLLNDMDDKGYIFISSTGEQEDFIFRKKWVTQ